MKCLAVQSSLHTEAIYDDIAEKEIVKGAYTWRRKFVK